MSRCRWCGRYLNNIEIKYYGNACESCIKVLMNNYDNDHLLRVRILCYINRLIDILIGKE